MAKMSNRKVVNAGEMQNVETLAALDEKNSFGKSLTFTHKAMTADQIDAGIRSFGKAGNKLLQTAHELCVAVVKHYIDHGDHTKFGAFIAAVNSSMGKGRVASFVEYVERYVPSLIVVPTVEGTKVTGWKFLHKRGANREFLADRVDPETGNSLLQIPFWVKPANAKPVNFSLKNEIEKIMERALKMAARLADESKHKPDDQIDMTGFESLKQVAEGLGFTETYFKMKNRKADKKAA